MHPDFIIKRALLSDAQTLKLLRLQLVKENPNIFGETYKTEKAHSPHYYDTWLGEYNSENAGIFIGYINNRAIGMCAVKQDTDIETGYFGSLGVINKYQGKGYGRMLLEYRLNWVKTFTHFKKIKTIITKSNRKMLSIAQKYGFKIVGEGFYKGQPEYVLEKELSSK